MARKCKKTQEAVKLRFDAFYRLARMRGFIPGLPSPEIFGSKPKKTGRLSIDDIVEGL